MTPLSKTTAKTASQSLEVVKKAETPPDLNLEGDLDMSDYVLAIKASEEILDSIDDWRERQKETTRTKLVMMLVPCVCSSVVAMNLLVCIAAFNPNADKVFIKDLITPLAASQISLMAPLGFYYFKSGQKKKAK